MLERVLIWLGILLAAIAGVSLLVWGWRLFREDRKLQSQRRYQFLAFKRAVEGPGKCNRCGGQLYKVSMGQELYLICKNMPFAPRFGIHGGTGDCQAAVRARTGLDGEASRLNEEAIEWDRLDHLPGPKNDRK